MLFPDEENLALDKLLSEPNDAKLLLVKLANFTELIILSDFNKKAINVKFYIFVKSILQKHKLDFKLHMTEDDTIAAIISSRISPKQLETIAVEIYKSGQLDLKFEPSEVFFYLRCSSISRHHGQNDTFEKLYSKARYILDKNPTNYYVCYEDVKPNYSLLENEYKHLSRLRISLEKKQIKFVYQPIVERKTGSISYYECLLRISSDEDNESYSVGAAIRGAEKLGLISVIDFTVIDMAVAELLEDNKLQLAINISNVGVLNPLLLNHIEALFLKYKVANRLIIEITETVINQDYQTTKNFIDRLHNMGCRFALDDFGSGFTSFKQLISLPLDIIKIDGSYVKDIVNNKHSKFFVDTLIKLSEYLGIKTVAEFVENDAIAKYLVELKVDGMQGNFFLPASDKRIE